MKTSIILIAALLFNTTLLMAEPLSELVKGINPWILVGLEIILVSGFFIHTWLKELNKACSIDFGYLNIFVFKAPEK